MLNEISTTEMAEIETAEKDPSVPERFIVHDDGSANWVIRRILEARSYEDRVKAWAEREIARARSEEDFFLFRFGQQLIDWVRARIAEQGGRRKSISLPAGTAGFRKEPPKIVVDDESAVIAWAKQHNPQLVGIVEKLRKSLLNDHVERTGEIPDAGAHIEPSAERFFIR